jgi:hypothetical protein
MKMLVTFFQMQRSEGVLEGSKFRGAPSDLSSVPLWLGHDAKDLVLLITHPATDCCFVVEMVVDEEQGECWGKRITGSEVCSLVVFYVAQFEKGRKTEQAQQQVRQNKWDPPLEDVYKINIDGAFRAATNQGGWGFVARNNLDEFLEGGYDNLCRVATSFQAEALAALYSL